MKQRPTPPKWKEFKKSANRSGPVKRQLWLDQGGICAYCEIDLAEADQSVEHHVPAHLTNKDVDWDLRWANLLLTCLGGSEPSLQGEGDYRYIAPPNAEKCCGFYKYGSEEEVLNPLKIDPWIPLFRVGLTTGKISPDPSACGAAGIDPDLVWRTVSLLNLNCFRLQKNRLAVINGLLEDSEDSTDLELAALYLNRNSDGCWPAFFTTFRFFLCNAAESHLAELDYYP
jgi:uncharacterized protein (TIGR02646 family)